MINDVRRAYFYAKIQRDVYIEFPKKIQTMALGLETGLYRRSESHLNRASNAHIQTLII